MALLSAPGFTVSLESLLIATGANLLAAEMAAGAFRHIRHVRIAGERAPDARRHPRPNPRRQNLGLPRPRRHVRRLRHHHHVEWDAVSDGTAPDILPGVLGS
jgi:hypothetical protein